jgi:hypothetical protein
MQSAKTFSSFRATDAWRRLIRIEMTASAEFRPYDRIAEIRSGRPDGFFYARQVNPVWQK